MNDEQLHALRRAPLIAILRGITPDEAVAVSRALAEAGFYFMEVTLDSPDWEDSINKIKREHGERVLLGAGTVLTPRDVDRVHAAGGRAVVSPHVSVEVIRRSKEHNLISIPGCCTPSECFTALQAGADMLKIFPAGTFGAAHIKALKVVLPKGVRLCPTGGIGADNVAAYLSAGAFAAGIGNSLYRPGMGAAELATCAQRLAAAVR